MDPDFKIARNGTNGKHKNTQHAADISPITDEAQASGENWSFSHDFRNVLTDIEYLIKDVAQLTSDDLTQTSLKINAHLANARKTVDAMDDTLAERAQKAAESTNDYVYRQPWTAIGIGATIGLALGAWLTRRT